jgi:hypothetical protein
MSLEIKESSEIIAKDPTQFRWWFQDQGDGYPAIVSGVLRRQDRKLFTGETYSKTFIEVSKAREVAVDDPVWAGFKINREQVVAPNRSLPPSQKSTSPVRGPED